jgi:hypothetical protein
MSAYLDKRWTNGTFRQKARRKKASTLRRDAADSNQDLDSGCAQYLEIVSRDPILAYGTHYRSR